MKSSLPLCLVGSLTQSSSFLLSGKGEKGKCELGWRGGEKTLFLHFIKRSTFQVLELHDHVGDIRQPMREKVAHSESEFPLPHPKSCQTGMNCCSNGPERGNKQALKKCWKPEKLTSFLSSTGISILLLLLLNSLALGSIIFFPG